MENMRCQYCDKELTSDMEIEYSKNTGDYFCKPDCAMSYYFEYMESTPFLINDKTPDELKERNIKVVNGKLYDLSLD